MQPDSIIPSPANPQSWNRYSYVTNRPVNATDPTGHYCVGDVEECVDDNSDDGGNSKEDNTYPPKHGPRSTLVYDFEFFPESFWNLNPSPEDDPLGWMLLQKYCSRRYGMDVECGVFQKDFGAPGEINLRIDAFGFRIEGSAWLMGGTDLNIDVLYFGRSDEFGLFASPGGQSGGGGGYALTGGILIAQNMPGRGSYAGSSYTAGGDIPIIPLGVNLEGEYSLSAPNADGSIPQTAYIGLGPLQGEIGSYTGASVAIPISDIWDQVFGK